LDDHGLFLFPSLFKGFGKAPIEAMARGLCVVAPDEGGMANLIESGTNGFLVKPGDAEAFSKRLMELSGNRPRIKAMSKRARNTATKFTWRQCAILATDFYLAGCKVNPQPEGQKVAPRQ